MSGMKRRHFLTQSGLAAVGVGLAKADASKASECPLILFEKPMQTLGYEQMGEELAKMGVKGIEATIRRGGHIEQKDAESEVPKMVASLAKNGQTAVIAATNVSEANEETAKFLQILKANGITKYRMDYYRYDFKKDLLPQVKENSAKLKELVALNKEIGMQSLYQVHAGHKMAGSLVWDLAYMFDGISPEDGAIAFDLRHVKVETGLSFKLALAALKKHIRSIYVKDSKWTGERGNKIKNVPLDTGLVNQKVYDEVRDGLPVLPVSLHMEWGKASIYPKADVMEAVENFARDVKVLKTWL